MRINRMDLILLGRVAIDFNPLDYNKPLYESETFKNMWVVLPLILVVGMARLGKKIGFLQRYQTTSSAHLWSVILRMKG